MVRMFKSYRHLEEGSRGRASSAALHQDQEDAGGATYNSTGVLHINANAAEDRSDNHLSESPHAFVDPAGDRYEQISDFGKIRAKVDFILHHLAFRAFTIILILVDIILVGLDLGNVGDREALETASVVIVSYFVIEVSIRMIVRGRGFLHSPIEVTDAVVVLLSFAFSMISIALNGDGNAKFAKLIVAGRLVRIVLVVRLFTQRKQLQEASRHIVSQNKRRYQKDGFDLDLCYVTDRVIAMSFPSSGIMSFYRNPIKEVAKFFETKHKDHYKIFNLCSERMYDESLFNYRVERIYIDDHNVPKLKEMLRFAKVARDWMKEDPSNVIAIHCKGGKGRTGTIVCVWLIESGTFDQAKDCLDYFGARRTDLSVGSQFQGVQTPSQSRYVEYFEEIKNNYDGQEPPSKTLILESITIRKTHGIGKGYGRDLSCTIVTDEKLWQFDFDKENECQTKYRDYEGGELKVDFQDKPILQGDVKVKFTCSSRVPKGYDSCAFYFWFHTSFIKNNTLTLDRSSLDNPHKENTWNVYKDGFGVELEFKPMS